MSRQVVFVQHHPTRKTRDAYVKGELAPGASLVVAAHLEMCEPCALQVETIQSVEGVMLDDDQLRLPPIPWRRPLPKSGKPRFPSVLGQLKAKPWKWAGPGLRLASMQSSAGPGEWLYLLRATPGAKLPRHSHNGAERIVLLQGAFSDESVRYRRGDMVENDARLEHQPVVDEDETCICLVATEGPLKLRGIGQWLQPYLGL